MSIFFTLRAFWKICKKRAFNKKAKDLQPRKKSYSHQSWFQKKRSKVITFNSNSIPVYPSELVGKSMWSPSSWAKAQQVMDNSLGKKIDHML